MCQTKPLNAKTETPSIRVSELGKRGLRSPLFESELSELPPKRIESNYKLELHLSNLITLMRNPSTNFATIKEYIEANPSEINTTEDLFHYSPLHYAVFHNRSDIVNLLCEKGANLNIQNSHGFTPVLCAADKNYTSIVKLLVKFGVDVNIPDNQGFSLLHKAVLTSNLELVQFLLSWTNVAGDHIVNINATSTEGFTPVHQAALHGYNKILKLLIANGASVDTVSRQKATPLHLAATKNNVKAAELLLLNGTNVDSQDKSNRTPLHYACLFGHVQFIRLLITYNADIHIRDRKNDSCLDLALKSNDSDIVASLSKP